MTASIVLLVQLSLEEATVSGLEDLKLWCQLVFIY